MTYRAFQVNKGDMPALIASIKRNRKAWFDEHGQVASTLVVRPDVYETMNNIFGKKLHVRAHAMPSGVFGITS